MLERWLTMDDKTPPEKSNLLYYDKGMAINYLGVGQEEIEKKYIKRLFFRKKIL